MQLVSECCWASLAVDQGRRHRREKWIQEASLSRFSQSLPARTSAPSGGGTPCSSTRTCTLLSLAMLPARYDTIATCCPWAGRPGNLSWPAEREQTWHTPQPSGSRKHTAVASSAPPEPLSPTAAAVAGPRRWPVGGHGRPAALIGREPSLPPLGFAGGRAGASDRSVICGVRALFPLSNHTD